MVSVSSALPTCEMLALAQVICWILGRRYFNIVYVCI